jgi:hypothetical protein
MAIGFRDSGNLSSSGTSISLSVSTITGLADDDFLVAVVLKDDDAACVWGNAQGWTKQTNLNLGDIGGRDKTVGVFTKVASGETGSWTFTDDQASPPTDNMAIVVNAFTGVDTGTPVDVSPTTSHRAAFQDSDTPDPTSITESTTNGAWVMEFCGFVGNTEVSPTFTQSTGYTTRGTNPDPFAQDNHQQIVTATKSIGTTGDDPDSMTLTGGAATADGVAGLIALRPAGGSNQTVVVPTGPVR